MGVRVVFLPDYPLVLSLLKYRDVGNGGSRNFFSRGVIGSIRNMNYINSKTKENLNITISKKKKSIQIHEILRLSFTMFHILKSLCDNFAINPINYIFFNVFDIFFPNTINTLIIITKINLKNHLVFLNKPY